jgi:hypothetical protein
LCPSCSRDSRASFIAQVPATKQGSTSWPVGLALECAYCVTVLLRVSVLVCVCGTVWCGTVVCVRRSGVCAAQWCVCGTVVCVRHSGVCAAQWCVCGTVVCVRHSACPQPIARVCVGCVCGTVWCGTVWCGTVVCVRHSACPHPLRTECVNYAYRVWPRVWWPRRKRSMTHNPIF